MTGILASSAAAWRAHGLGRGAGACDGAASCTAGQATVGPLGMQMREATTSVQRSEGLWDSARQARSSSAAGLEAPAPVSLMVRACPPDCSMRSTPGLSSWCKAAVAVPQLDWKDVFDSDPALYPSFLLAPGLSRFDLPQGLEAFVVSSAEQVDQALRLLRASMQDAVITIDLEWQPDRGGFSGNASAPSSFSQSPSSSSPSSPAALGSPVAVIQLATSTTCVIVHLAPTMRFALPIGVEKLLRASDIQLVSMCVQA
jgi:hypothetical protein